MGVLKDIIDTTSDIKNTIKNLDVTGKDPLNKIKLRGKSKSIANMASDSILQFPVLIDTALSADEVNIITKALEREYASFVAILTSVNSITDAGSIKQYLKSFHTNENTKLSNMISESSLIENCSVFKYRSNEINKYRQNDQNIYESISNSKLLINGELKSIIEDNEVVVNYNDLDEQSKQIVNESLAYLQDGKNIKYKNFQKDRGIDSLIFEDTSLNEEKHVFIIKNFENNSYRLLETVCLNNNQINESVINQLYSANKKLLNEYTNNLNSNSLNTKTGKIDNFSIIGEKSDLNTKINDAHRELNTIKRDMTPNKTNTNFIDYSNKREISINKSGNSVTRFTDIDSKKANELVPTLLTLNTYFKDNDGKLQQVEYLIGIKCVTHRIDSESMSRNLSSVIKSGKGFLNLIKMTTGEISFVKDFLFAVNRTKDEIKSSVTDNRWWTLLKRKKRMSKISAKFGKNVPPTTTIVVSMDTVEKIKIDYDIDIMKLSNTKKIVNDLLLLGICILDSSVNTAYIYFDSNPGYEEYTYTQLERENKNSKKELANVLQLLSKM